MSDLNTLHDEYRRAVEAVRDETMSPEARVRAEDDLVAKREALDEARVEETVARKLDERAEQAEAEERAKAIVAGQSVEAVHQPTLRDKYDEWEEAGRPGKFRFLVYPNFEDASPRSKYEHWGNRPADVEGRSWKPTIIEQRADIINETGNQGGAYLWPTKTFNDVAMHEMAVSGVMASGPRIIQTPDMADIVVPTFATDAAGTATAEGTESTESVPVFAHFHLTAYRNDLHFHVGHETLKSSVVPLESILSDACARALAEKLGSDLAVGVGSTTAVQGLSGHATGVITTGVTTASADSITMDEVIALKLSVLPGARKRGSFIFASTAYALLAKLKNDAGSYYWEPSIQAGAPDRLLGQPCFEDPYYDATGTTAHDIATFGDMSTYYVRFAGPVIIEASDAPTWTSFETTWRAAQYVGAWPSDYAAIKTLTCV